MQVIWRKFNERCQINKLPLLNKHVEVLSNMHGASIRTIHSTSVVHVVFPIHPIFIHFRAHLASKIAMLVPHGRIVWSNCMPYVTSFVSSGIESKTVSILKISEE
ncbi:hypothetical protein VNO77_33160 [Canavalia gladiata]|uniref:Uncharacterized protein n=1 Tax=Canavalia gladiata TaxID=3824 RepID=A0AAN9KDC9_CANGL